MMSLRGRAMRSATPHEAEVLHLWQQIHREVARRCKLFPSEVRQDAAADEFMRILERARAGGAPPHPAAGHFGARHVYRALAGPMHTGVAHAHRARPRATRALVVTRGDARSQVGPDEWIDTAQAAAWTCDFEGALDIAADLADPAAARRRHLADARLLRRQAARAALVAGGPVAEALERLAAATPEERARAADLTGVSGSTLRSWLAGEPVPAPRLADLLVAAATVADPTARAANEEELRTRALTVLGGMSTRAAAWALGVSQPTASLWRSGKRRLPLDRARQILALGAGGAS